MKTIKIHVPRRLEEEKLVIYGTLDGLYRLQQAGEILADALNPRELSDYAFNSGAIEVRHEYDLTKAEDFQPKPQDLDAILKSSENLISPPTITTEEIREALKRGGEAAEALAKHMRMNGWRK